MTHACYVSFRIKIPLGSDFITMSDKFREYLGNLFSKQKVVSENTFYWENVLM